MITKPQYAVVRKLLGATALCASLASLPHVARAADAPTAESEGQGLSEIIVTAQKRPENLQQTPISISVMKSEDLVNRHVTSLLDLGDGAVPSLRVAESGGRSSALVMNIRGIGVLPDTNQPARDQGVGVYVDGVYLGRAQGLGAALYDIENIEVLKGPQGTLFGRNTEGGAVNITTKKPSGVFGMSTTAGIGNYGSYKVETHIDLPEFQNIRLKFDGVVTARDGMVDNPLTYASDFQAYSKRGLRVEALWKPTTNFSADYAYDTGYDASTPGYLQVIAAGSAARAPLALLQPSRASVSTIGVPLQPSIGRTSGHRLGLEWQVHPSLSLKSITSYRELTQSQFDSGAYNASVFAPNGFFARYSNAFFRQDQVSEELQAIGETDRLKYAVGALFYEENVEDNAQAFNTLQWNATGTAVTVLPIDPATASIDRASRIKTESFGVYSQVTYTPPIAGDIVHLTGGLRYTHDRKRGELFTLNGSTPVSVNGVVGPIKLNASWSRVDPMINLAIEPARDVMLYAKWSTGFKSGGANTRSLTFAKFNPETVSVFEVGGKAEFWNRRARLNIAAYAGNYKDVQLDFTASFLQFDINGNLLNGTRTTQETTNAPGTGHLHGVEAELTLMPVDGLTLSASYAFNSVTIPNTANPFPVVSNGTSIINPNPVKIYPVYTPRHAATGSIDYEVPLGGAKLRFHLDANYDSGYYTSYNDPSAVLAQPKGDANVVVNGRLAIADIPLQGRGATATLSAWARNLLNEQHMFFKAANGSIGTYGYFNEPRAFGVEANVRF